MAFFKRKNLLSRRTCSYCFVVVAMASLFILYYCHRQPSSLSSDVYIHSDTRLQKLNGQERTLYQNNIINDLSPFVGGGSINSSYRFVLGLNYWEQLTMATMNLFQLACLSDNWNASVIQPFTLNSRLYGLRNFKADEKITKKPAFDLDLIYDMKTLNSLLVKHRLPSFVKFRDYLKLASRQLIVIHYIPITEAHELKVMKLKNGSWIRSALKKNSVAECGSYLKGYQELLTKSLNAELLAASVGGQPFSIVKYVCVNMSVLTTPQELGAKVGIPSRGGMSVVIVNWRGTSKNTMIINSAKGAHLNKRVSMANVCQINNVSALVSEVLPHSTSVTKMVDVFGSSIGLKTGQDFIAVHLRSEKIGLREARFPNALEACVKELMTVRRRLANAHPSMNIIDMTDFGPYSSDTCRTCKSALVAGGMYKDEGIKSVYFDPANFDAPHDRGFASAVDVELLASSSYLVLCGGGAFQNQAALRFLANGKTRDRLIQVCMTDSSVNDTIQAHRK